MTCNATRNIYEIDLAASFAAGTPVYLTTYDMSATTSTSGIEIATIGGTEYLIVMEYIAGATGWLYVVPFTEVTDGGTFALTDRLKRFVLPRECQGGSMHPTDGYLYTAHNGTSSVNDGPVYVYDIATAIASVADGGALPEVRRHQTPSQYPEDLTWHPVTGECWIATEGYDAVDDYDPFMAAWRSPLVADEPVWQEVLIDYDGAGELHLHARRPVLRDCLSHTERGARPHRDRRVSVLDRRMAGRLLRRRREQRRVQGQAVLGRRTRQAAGRNLRAADADGIHRPVVNPGAETGDLTGWTVTSGAGGVAHIRPDPALQAGRVANTRVFFGGNLDGTVLTQRFNIATVTGLTTTEIDDLIAGGNMWATADWWNSNFNGTDDPSAIALRWLNASNTSIRYSSSDLAAEGMQAEYWFRRNWSLAGPGGRAFARSQYAVRPDERHEQRRRD